MSQRLIQIARLTVPVLALVGLVLFMTYGTSRSMLPERELSISELRAELMRALADDPAATYEEFVRRYEDGLFEESHGKAHLFGEVLFTTNGIGGIAVCDERFNFGCYHGFVRAAIAALGLEVVAPLDAACEKPACQHGIGHGILEYVGHDQLEVALAACAKTTQTDPMAGCTGGVFMEYNVPLTLGEQGEFQITARMLTDPTDPYAPCDTLSSAFFRTSCYHELPQWWKQVYPEDYGEFGRLCAAVSQHEHSQACMLGIAKIIPQTAGYDIEASEALCAMLPGVDAYGDCIVQAAWALRENNGDLERARALCAYAPEEKKAGCPT